MTYTLQIDLLGGEKVEAILQKLQGLTGALGTGGSIFGGGTGGASPVSKQAEDVSKLTRQVQAGTVGVHALGKELKNLGQGGGVSSKMMDLLRALKPGSATFNAAWEQATQSERDAYNGVKSAAPSGSAMRVNLKSAQQKAQEKAQKDLVTFQKDMSFLMMPLFNPGSMWATLFSGRQTYSAMNTEHGAAFRNSKLGGMGAGAATGLLVAGATVAGLVLKALAITVKETVAAYEHARQIYSKALQNGMGLQWSTKRGMLAQIMGVSEQDVVRFGAQMAYLNPKLENAAKILARTATPLTQVSWNAKILSADFQALVADMSVKLAPALNAFIGFIDEIVKGIDRIGNLFSDKDIQEAIDLFFMKPGFGEKLADKFTLEQKSMPSPQAWMKQLPASHWEKMGLVTMGGSQNYAKDTAKNTRDTAKAVTAMAKHFMGIGKGPGNHVWGMSPFTAQP